MKYLFLILFLNSAIADTPQPYANCVKVSNNQAIIAPSFTSSLHGVKQGDPSKVYVSSLNSSGKFEVLECPK